MDQQNRYYQQYHRERTVGDKQTRLLAVIAALCGALLLCSIVFMVLVVPPAVRAMNTIAEIGETADIAETIENAKALIIESREGVEQAAEKIDSFDIEKLNETIEALNTIIEPLARLFGKG